MPSKKKWPFFKWSSHEYIFQHLQNCWRVFRKVLKLWIKRNGRDSGECRMFSAKRKKKKHSDHFNCVWWALSCCKIIFQRSEIYSVIFFNQSIVQNAHFLTVTYCKKWFTWFQQVILHAKLLSPPNAHNCLISEAV